jgi:type III secretion protein D
MRQELRVLCGLHRGACLPVVPGESLSVGSGQDCDVVLVDAGMREHELSLQADDDGVLLTRTNERGEPLEPQRLAWGQPWVCAEVVLVVCVELEPWQFMTAAEVPEPLPVLTESVDHLVNEPAASLRPSANLSFMGRMHVLLSQKKMRLRLGAMAVIMLGFTTYSISRTIQQSYASAPVFNGSDKVKELMTKGQQQPLLIEGKLAPERAKAAAGTASPAIPLSQAELQSKVKQRLRDAFLLEKLEVELSETNWTFRGVLDEDESRLLGRLLATFYKEHDVKSQLNAYVSSPEDMLPFKIQHFTSGAMANVVTSDGQRLYVGDSHRGYTLQRIDGKKLLFAGKKKVEVIW